VRIILAYLAVAALLAACSQSPAGQSNAAPPAAAAQPPGAPVSGVYIANGKPAVLTDVSIHPDDPIDGKPVHAFVFTVSPQAGDIDVISDAHQGKLGDAIIIRVQEDGAIAGADLVHHGLDKSNGYASMVGVLSIDNYRVSGGEISGHVTSAGPSNSSAGQQINVDVTFHAKAP
jgi:hypothetical protein